MKYTLFVLILIFIFSCEKAEENLSQDEGILTNEIYLSKEKVEAAGIKTGSISEIPVSEKVYCKGKLSAKPNNRVKYSSPLDGFIKRIYIQNGKYVKKGAVLLTLEHPDFIEIQKNYLIAESNKEYLKKEYERQKILFESKAGKKKEFEKVNSDYENAKIEYSALKALLKMININPGKLSSDNIRSSINLYSPISGYVNEVKISIGQHVNSEDVLFEIINNNDFFLELNVFERDIQKIHIGQKLSYDFSIPESTDSISFAKIVSVGNYIDPLKKTFIVHAKPEKQTEGMRHGMFVNAEIHLNSEKVYALPDEAIINQDDKNFIFLVKDETTFSKTEIQTGKRSNDFTEILSPVLKDKRIVLHGANYIRAELDNE